MGQIEKKAKARLCFAVGILLTCTLASVTLISVASAATLPKNEQNDFNVMDEAIQAQQEELDKIAPMKDDFNSQVQERLKGNRDYATEEQLTQIDELMTNLYNTKSEEEYNDIAAQVINILDTIDQNKAKKIAEEEEKTKKAAAQAKRGPSASHFRQMGEIYYNGHRFTYYSSRVLYHYKTPQWHTNDAGFWCDNNGYLIVASNDYSQGSLIDTPWGTGIVRDSGCDSGTVDMYVSW